MKSLTLKHIIFQFFALCSLLFLSGCYYSVDNRLTDIENIIDEFPDSALSMLYELDDTCLNSRKDIEIKNILLTEALYKNDVVETDDSLISEATEFFDNKLDNKYRAKAYYLKGIINIYAKKYSDAIISLLNAEKSASLIKDSLMMGLIHRSLGDTFSYLKDYSGALNYYKISYSEFNAHKNNNYKDWALYDVARAFHNAVEYDSCRIVGKYMLTLLDKHQLHIPRKYVLSLMANNEYRAKNYHHAMDYF